MALTIGNLVSTSLPNDSMQAQVRGGGESQVRKCVEV